MKWRQSWNAARLRLRPGGFLEQSAITSAIVGARTLEQARDNLGAGGWVLPADALKRLNDVSHLPDRYPKSMEANMDERRDSAVDMSTLDRRS